ncbi:MAG: cation transporter, partial [Arthrobacter sp.]
GWWWADAGAALLIAVIAVREGLNAWRGDVCCTVPGGTADLSTVAVKTTGVDESSACCGRCDSSP